MPPFSVARESIAYMRTDIEPKSVQSPGGFEGSVEWLYGAAGVIYDLLDRGKPSAPVIAQFIE